MMDAETFWSLARRLTPARVFTEVVPELPDILPKATIARAINVHVLGSGAGVWSLRLVQGRLTVVEGGVSDALCQIACERSAFREVIGGALRDRGLEVMAQIGRPGQLPDLRHLPVDSAQLEAVGNLAGSVAIEVEDRELRQIHRFVITFGSDTPAYDEATTTVRFDVDDWVGWTAQRRPPIGVLRGGKVRISGDLALPLRALRALLGAGAEE